MNMYLIGDRDSDLDGDLENLTGDLEASREAASWGFFEDAGPALDFFIEAGPAFWLFGSADRSRSVEAEEMLDASSMLLLTSLPTFFAFDSSLSLSCLWCFSFFDFLCLSLSLSFSFSLSLSRSLSFFLDFSRSLSLSLSFSRSLSFLCFFPRYIINIQKLSFTFI